jgi:hypothetical protein
LEYVGSGGAGSIVEGASTTSEALKKYRENKNSFKHPVVRTYANSGWLQLLLIIREPDCGLE